MSARRRLLPVKRQELFFVMMALLMVYILSYLLRMSLVVHPPPTRVEREFFRNVTARKLVLLQMVFRHGHRAPFNLYPNDVHDISFWKEGLGQLTQLGRLQHYVVGDHLLKRYRNFITQDAKEVELLSADSARCQYGAFSFVAGLYPPVKERAFTEELKWQPIVCHHYPGPENRWILSRRKCPVAAEEEREYKSSREADDLRNKYKVLYEFWSEHSGRNIKDWTRAADLGKTMACERDYNLSVPEWGLRYWEELELQAGLSYYWNFRTKLIQRLRSGPLLGHLMQMMLDKAAGRILEKNVFVYSAHGSNIACLLLSLGQYNFRSPPHASTLVIELWEETVAGHPHHSVRWLYFNSSSPEKRIEAPFILRPQGCGGEEFCPLQIFEEAIRDFIPDDWVRECNDFSQRRRFPPPEYMFVSTASRAQVSFVLCTLFWILIVLKPTNACF